MFIINNQVWYIVFVSPYNRMLYRQDGSLSIGCCDNSTKTIYVNKMLNDSLLYKVLCHEITHAAMFSYNIFLTKEQEELIADLIATYGNEIIDVTNRVFAKLKGGY